MISTEFGTAVSPVGFTLTEVPEAAVPVVLVMVIWLVTVSPGLVPPSPSASTVSVVVIDDPVTVVLASNP